MRIILFGVLAALFFSATFVLNRAMSLSGGHWVWSAVLRYAWMLLILVAGLWASGRTALLRDTFALYRRHLLFWTLAGSKLTRAKLVKATLAGASLELV